MGWIGLDDTDGLSGGCTTDVMRRIITSLIDVADEQKWQVSETPSLVRLWPFAHRRTRGNAAVSCEVLCHSEESEKALLAHLDKMWSSIVLPEVLANGSATVSEHSERNQSDASPAMIWCPIRPSDEWYWKCVRREVTLSECQNAIPDGCRVWQADGGHGLIGALAAISWVGSHDHTWEVTAYRIQSNVAAPRRVPVNRCDLLDDKFPQTILNRDPTNSKSLLSPRTPCPVLFGIRSETSASAIAAAKWIIGSDHCEPVSGWQLWKTNQATDDHIENMYTDIVCGKVVVKKQGHTSFSTEKYGVMISFAQGGNVNKLAQQLREGDRIEYSGLVAPDGVTHIEKMRVISLSDNRKLRPLCSCGKRMKSMGAGQGVRCPKCGEKQDDSWSEEVSINISFSVGQWVEPSASYRRHLAAPISRKYLA